MGDKIHWSKWDLMEQKGINLGEGVEGRGRKLGELNNTSLDKEGI